MNSTVPPASSGSLRWVLLAGALIGVLDLAFAIGFWSFHGVSPIRIPHSIAAGLLGRDAYSGGASTAALGVALHFFIAGTIALAYYLASGWWPVLVRRAAVCGLAYGLAVYLFMQLVVLPLSAAGTGPWQPVWVGASVAAHLVLIGLPAALFARRARSVTLHSSSHR